ncbi:MAG: hypothetical protein ABJB04_01745, partial [Betaproteobacteria bacterium]
MISSALWTTVRARAAGAVQSAGFAAALAVSPHAGALDLDPGFGGGRGYVPISAVEPQSDIAVGMIRQPDDKLIVMGTRLVGTRGTLLFQRYAPDGTLDPFYGTFGTTTISVAGVALTGKQLFLQNDGRVLAFAETATGLRAYSLLPNGQPDTAFGTGGELQIPFAPGVGPGSNSVQLKDTGQFIVIGPSSPAGGSLTLLGYLPSGVVDDGFGLHGKEVVSGLGAGLIYTGVATQLIDRRYVLVLAGPAGARALVILDDTGLLDSANDGKPVFPAPLQGLTITRLSPLFSGYFVAVGVSGAGGAQTSTITRLDPTAHVDPQFATNGVLTVQAADSGGSIAIVDVYETPDNTLILTGSTNNGLIVARYLARGQVDVTFNNGKGSMIVPEPGSLATVGLTSLQYANGRILHLATGILRGTGPSGNTPSRAFLISSVEGVPDVNFASVGILNLFGRSAPNSEFAEHVVPLADGRVLVLSADGPSTNRVGSLTRLLADGSGDPSFGVQGRVSFPLNGKCEWPLSMAVQPDGKVLVIGSSFNMIDCDTGAIFGRRFNTNGVDDSFQLGYTGTTQHARSADVVLQPDGKIVVT